MKNMTKEQAIEAMRNGKKVTHYLFCNNEFIYMIGEEIHDEKGYNINSEFWKNRTEDFWKTNWFIFE